jgi:hypothetical protein
MAQLIVSDGPESNHGREALNRSGTPQIIERCSYAGIPVGHHTEKTKISIVR